jgi:hypothetical protein
VEWIPEDWEIVSRKTNGYWIEIFATFTLGLLLDSNLYPHSSVTWTVRQKSTGLMRRVTALGEREAADKIVNVSFDSDQAALDRG